MGWVDGLGAHVLALIAPQCCVACDQGLDGAPPEVFCSGCGPLLEPLERGLGAYRYGGPLATALQRYKYGGESWLARPLGSLLADVALRRHAGRVDAVVPVPLHPRRLRERGYDQAALLAAEVADLLGVPLLAGRLERRRRTVPQARLGAARRLDNVRGAFRVRMPRRQRDEPLPSRLLLVDDVTTTGATLREAALALRDAGAERVLRIALAQRLAD